MGKTPSTEEVLSAAPPRVCFRSGPTRYYFFYGGTRHYYGTRTWTTCNPGPNKRCDQSVYLDQASWTINAVCTGTANRVDATCTGTADAGETCDLDASTDSTAECPTGCDSTDAYTPTCDLDASTAPTALCPAGCSGFGQLGFSGYETPNQIKRAISAQWIGVNQNLIQVTCSSTTCSVQVMLPDGSSKYQFQSTIQNGCPVDGSGGAAYTSAGVNPGGTVSCSAVSLTRIAVQPESGVRPQPPPPRGTPLLFKPRGN